MTTAAHDGRGVQVAGARVVRRAPRRLRIVGGSERLRWWHGRLTLGTTLAGAMVGALLGVVQGYYQSSLAPVPLLEAYGAGAGAGTSAGLVLGLVLGLMLGLVDRYLLPQDVSPRQVWVRYRRTASRSS